jgi:diketogulonate reductase-like aldo/keto reductase
MKFLLQLSPLVNVVPKSVTPARISENFALDGFELTPAQVERFRPLNAAWRTTDGLKLFGYDVWAIGV